MPKPAIRHARLAEPGAHSMIHGLPSSSGMLKARRHRFYALYGAAAAATKDEDEDDDDGDVDDDGNFLYARDCSRATTGQNLTFARRAFV